MSEHFSISIRVKALLPHLTTDDSFTTVYSAMLKSNARAAGVRIKFEQEHGPSLAQHPLCWYSQTTSSEMSNFVTKECSTLRPLILIRNAWQ